MSKTNPVDALKEYAEAMGLPLTPGQETYLRSICDEEVFVACGCSVKDGHKPECQEAQVKVV